jgi:hypothetical protein
LIFRIDISVFLLAALMLVATYNDAIHLLRQWARLE